MGRLAVKQLWNARNLVKVSRSRAVLVPVQTVTVPAPNDTTRAITVDNARYISYPTALYGWCATRRKHVETPSYSLPAHLACPSAVTDNATYQRIKAKGLARRNAKLDTRGPECDHEPRFVCAMCYASKGTFRFTSTVLSHLARYDDSKRAVADYVRVAYLPSTLEAKEQLLTGTYVNPEYPDLIPEWVRYVQDMIRAYEHGISGYTSCECCVPRIRHHASGDVWSPGYADLLAIVFGYLVAKYPTLIIWVPTRNGHLMVGIRLLSATLRLGEIERVNVVCSSLIEDLPLEHDPAYVGTDTVAYQYRSLSMVGSNADAITSAGYTVCHKQSGSATHTCDDCIKCYVPGTRVGFISH